MIVSVLTGLGGVGKTQIALEFAYRNASIYSAIWWLRADTTQILDGDYRQLGVALGARLPDAAPPAQVRTLAREAVESVGDVLLVFDNAPDYETIREFLPQWGNALCLVTSRNPNWGLRADDISVGVFARTESNALLSHILQRQPSEIPDSLAHELGDLPLALAQAGAYIAETAIGIEEYLVLFRSRREELWKQERAPADYPDRVETAWKISTGRLATDEPLSLILLSACCFLAPDGIPRRIFALEGSEPVPEAVRKVTGDRLAQNRALAALRRFSLIELTSTTISVHRLVQLVTRDSLSEASKVHAATLALVLLREHLPEETNDRGSRDFARQLIPHIKSAVALTTGIEDHALSAVRAQLLNAVAMHIEGLGQVHEAAACLRQALLIIEETVGRKHYSYFAVANNLASALREIGNYKESRKLFDRVVAYVRRQREADPRHTAQVLTNFGLLLNDLGELTAARRQHEEALRIALRAYDSDHPKIGLFLNNLALTLKGMGEYRQAKQLFEEALRLEQGAHGPEFHGLIEVRNNIGLCLRELKEPREALLFYEQAMTLAVEWYGERSQRVATILNNIGVAHRDLGNLTDAKRYAEWAVAVDEAVYGADHPEVAINLMNLVVVFEALEDREQAVQAATRAWRIFRRTHGGDDMRTLNAAAYIAALRQRRSLSDLLAAPFSVTIDDDTYFHFPTNPEQSGEPTRTPRQKGSGTKGRTKRRKS